jgi:hypothetical protein
MAERIVDGGDKMQPVADHGDDLAIAGVAHAFHGIAVDDRLGGRGLDNRTEDKNGRECARSNAVHHHRHQAREIGG